MEINPLSKVPAVESFSEKKEGRLPGRQTVFLAISKSINASLAKLVDWIGTYSQNPQEMSTLLAELIEIADSYDQAYKSLESFKKTSQDTDEIQAALEVETNLENAFKKIGKLTLAPYWKYGDFSFIFLFSVAHHVPHIDLKPMVLHLFEKISPVQWEQTQDILKSLVDQLA